MSEKSKIAPGRKLWFDGPNYTADGIVIHMPSRQVLLIKRGSGEWALPGGFIDANEDALEAARREVHEETGVMLESEPSLVFCGLVDDPRSSSDAWIETSAYLFEVDDLVEAAGQDDAIDADWHSLDNLPELYASHGEILTRVIGMLAMRAAQ